MANLGVCNDLMNATPGLYGLCIAFCEAQDCLPDPNAEDPFGDCPPPSNKLLQNYRKLVEPGDPDMPCVKADCPCWTEDEVAELRGPLTSDYLSCFSDHSSTGVFTRHDEWDIFGFAGDTPELLYRSAMTTEP